MSGGRPPVALTIAGSDSGAGAGVQGDLKTFAAHQVYGVSVVTAVTAQNTREISHSITMPEASVEAQLRAVLTDFGVAAVKTGMLVDAGTVRLVARFLKASPALPLVVDPVLRSTSGAPLLADDALDVLRRELMPRAALITPNREEAARLAGGSPTTVEAAINSLAQDGARAVLVTGGDGDGDDVVDVLWDGETTHELRHRRIGTTSTHGTGCALSAAITARLARGDGLLDAVNAAEDWLVEALEAAFPLGGGHGPIHHFCRDWSTG